MSNTKPLSEPMFAIIHITWQAPDELFMFLWQCDRDVACFEGANEKLLPCDDEVECQMFLLHFVARSKRQLPSKILCLSILGVLYNHVLIMISRNSPLQWRHNEAMASQITSLAIVYTIVYSGADQRKHQSSASLAFVRGIHQWPVNSPHKWPVTRKMFPFDDVIMMPEVNSWFNILVIRIMKWLMTIVYMSSPLFVIIIFKYIFVTENACFLCASLKFVPNILHLALMS